MSTRVLFVCIHNSARSQMAEELLRKYGGDQFDARSAGLEPGRLNPFVIRALQEEGIDIEGKPTQGVADLLQEGQTFDYVITVCDEASAERCPVFPGNHKKFHWGFNDPSQFEGSDEEKLAAVRVVREEIRETITRWLKQEFQITRAST